MFISKFGCSSIGRSGENGPLRVVRVLTKFRRRIHRSCGYSGYPKGG